MSQLDQAFIRAYDDNQQADSTSNADYIRLSGTRLAAKVVRPLSVRDRIVQQITADKEQATEPPKAEESLKLACVIISDADNKSTTIDEQVVSPPETTQTELPIAQIFTSSIAIDPESIVETDLVETRATNTISEQIAAENNSTEPESQINHQVRPIVSAELLADSNIVQESLELKLGGSSPLDEVVLDQPEEIDEEIYSVAGPASESTNGISSRFESFSTQHYQEAQQQEKEEQQQDILSMHPLSQFLEEPSEEQNDDHAEQNNEVAAFSNILEEGLKGFDLEVDHFLWPTVVDDLSIHAAGPINEIYAKVMQCLQSDKTVLGWVGCQSQVGTTTLLLTLAKKMATKSQSVLLVDSVMRSSCLTQKLGLSPKVGWEDALSQGLNLADVLIQSKQENLTILPVQGDAQKLHSLTTTQLAEQINSHLLWLRQKFSCVLIDMGNLQQQEQMPLISKINDLLIDGVVVVCDSQSRMDRLPQKMIGVVENFNLDRTTVSKVG